MTQNHTVTYDTSETHLERSRDRYETVRAEVLQTGRVDRHQIDDIARRARTTIAGQYECFLVYDRHESGTHAHARLEANLEVLLTNTRQTNFSVHPKPRNRLTYLVQDDRL